MKSLYTLILVLSVTFASCDNSTSTKKSSSSSTQNTEKKNEGSEDPTVEEKKTPSKPVYSFAFATKEGDHKVPYKAGGSYTWEVVEENTPTTDKREIAYRSSNDAIATVDETTGTVIFKTQGTVIITAEKAEKGEHEKVSDTYTLYITVKPADKPALVAEIDRAMKAHGNRVDLNYIDTSAITNMNDLFSGDAPKTLDVTEGYGLSTFAGDISKWDVSRVDHMNYMFYRATAFNSDISKWNVSSVTTMVAMFWGATAFTQNLNDWGSKLNAQIKSLGTWSGASRMFKNSGLKDSLPDWCKKTRCKDLQ